MKDDRIYLIHIRDAIDKILKYVECGKIEFMKDSKTHDAVIRNLEIIGEAVKNISQKLRQTHPNVPWKRIAGMRDKIVHEYFGVDLHLVWDVTKQELPKLRQIVEELVNKKT